MFYSKNVYNSAKHGFVTTILSQKKIVQRLSSKENLLGTSINKECDADSLLGHERTVLISFKKSATISSASYCQFLKQN